MYITLNPCILLGEAAMQFRNYANREAAHERRKESSVVTLGERKGLRVYCDHLADSSSRINHWPMADS